MPTLNAPYLKCAGDYFDAELYTIDCAGTTYTVRAYNRKDAEQVAWDAHEGKITSEREHTETLL